MSSQGNQGKGNSWGRDTGGQNHTWEGSKTRSKTQKTTAKILTHNGRNTHTYMTHTCLQSGYIQNKSGLNWSSHMTRDEE